MPRPGPRRPVVAIRLGEEERALVEARAEGAGISLSEQIRRDIDRANHPRIWAEWEADMWSRINSASEDAQLDVMRRELTEIDQVRHVVAAALDKRANR